MVDKQNFDKFVTVMRLAWQVGNRKDHASLRTLRKWADEMAQNDDPKRRRQNSTGVLIELEPVHALQPPEARRIRHACNS